MDVLSQFLASFAVCATSIWALIPLSKRLGWLDAPDDRKQHETPTPPVGGFGLFLGLVLPAFFVLGINREIIGFTVAAVLLVVVGALDDRLQLPWKWRIVAQVLASLVLIYGGGVRAEHVGPLFGFGDIELGWLSVPFTVFITVGLINAMNMLDGIDGLVGTVSVAVTCMFICAALYSGAYDVAFGLFWLLGALFGFLLFNKRHRWQPKARVFLGDAGSGLIGFTMAFVIFRLTQNPGHPISPVLGPFLLALPIIDCLVLIVHRLRRGLSPFAAGRDHVHHLLLDAGYSVNQIVRLLTLMTCISGLFGALCLLANVPAPMMVMAYLIVMFIWFWITEIPERSARYFNWLKRTVYR
jgi:UDP-GlcNAc:undecaprenyl-phosphate/decaprenyl-phosphate GlcNAc-1-phosphate transferase